MTELETLPILLLLVIGAFITNILVSMWFSFERFKVVSHEELKVQFPSVKETLSFQIDIVDPSLIPCIDPATGRFLGTREAATPSQMKAIVSRAKTAQEKYASIPFGLRKAMLRTLLDWIVAHQSEICRVVALDTGKTELDASFGDVMTTCEKIRWTIQNGAKVLRSEYRKPGMLMAHKIPRVDYVPLGVMGCIVSWNYPFHNAMGPVISALMAGNACVVKCSEQVAFTTDFLSSLMDSLLNLYGFDTNLVQFVNGYADAGQALVETADKITFIGSPGVGKAVMKHAANTLTPVILELGGKDCAIVFEDCDYDQFLGNSQRYAFQNAGQNCAGLERVIIHEDLYERYVDDITRIVSSMRVGPPLLSPVDMGAVTMANQINIIENLVQDAVAKGAIPIIGGKRHMDEQFPLGQFFEPTILLNITPDMKIYHEEVFGPVLLVFKFSDEQEALEIANGTEFGLGSGVFSLDYSRAERFASKLKVGFTNMNDFGVNYLCQGLPFGGVGKSGFDRFAGVEGLRGNCVARAVTTDKYRWFGVRTKLPALLKYPISPDGLDLQQGLLSFLFSATWTAKIVALGTVLKLAMFGRTEVKKTQ